MPAHFLRRGFADAYLAGATPRFYGVVVQLHSLPREPWCFEWDPFPLYGGC